MSNQPKKQQPSIWLNVDRHIAMILDNSALSKKFGLRQYGTTMKRTIAFWN